MIKQYFGIKYPITCENENRLFIDLNESLDDKIKSQILHVLFTPKGQRLRNPNFGTNLLEYLFTPNEKNTWDKIKKEIISSINSQVKDVVLNDISQTEYQGDDDHTTAFKLVYTTKKGVNEEITETIITI